ncbi:MAG: DUF4389 domain-containing protein [Proteobacteria bacterium]|nr:MAG: DUF4389 domain-containing protein [Pseudomonadota bacterium]
MQYDHEVDESRSGLWFRLLWMFLFYLLLFYAVSVIVAVILVCQFVLVLVNGAPNGRLREFSDRLNRYAHEILQYLSFNESRKPFPFSEFPDAR